MRLASRQFSFSIVLGNTVKSIRGVQSLKQVFEVWSRMWKPAYVFFVICIVAVATPFASRSPNLVLIRA